MIRLGFSRRGPAGTVGDTDVGMLDVSANVLAVLILATMLVISAAAPPVPRGEVLSDDTRELFYPSPIEAVLAPHSRYVFVLNEGLVTLDLDAFAQALATGDVIAETDQGSMTLVTDRRMYRDLNDYRASLTPNWTALREAAKPLDEAAVEEEAEMAADGFASRGVATTYLVSAEALSAFAPLYWSLRDGQVPIRWSSVPVGQNFVFQRRVDDFEQRSRQWQ